MKKIQIPNTDLLLSPFGLGTLKAGVTWNDYEVDKLFNTYLDLEGNILDTAHVYSDWIKPETARSERIIGDWLKRSGRRCDIILITKGGHPDMTLKKPDMHNSRMRKSDMIKDLNGSLSKLQTDYIDIYFYHRDDANLPVEETIETMESFVREGKIRYYGCSNWSTKRMISADRYCKERGYRGFVANQALYNMGSKAMIPGKDDTMVTLDDEMYQYHTKTQLNIAMPYKGVCGGFFHYYEKGISERYLKSNYYTSENIKVGGKIFELKEKYGATLTQILLGFYKYQDFECIPLYGPRSVTDLFEAAKTYDTAFKKEDFSFSLFV